MTLREYWEILRRAWLLIVTTTVLGILAAFGMSLLTTPIYQSQSQLFVSVQNADEISGAYTAGLYVQDRIQSYVTLVNTPDVLDPVIDELDLSSSYTALADQVSALNPPGTVLLNVLVTDVSPSQAAEIADATAASLAAEIERLETTGSGAKPVKVELIRPAQVEDAPITPRTQLNLVLGALLGLFAGVGIAVLRSAMDSSIKSVDDLQDATQATLLGSVAHDPGAAKNPLITLKGGPRAEAYRSIRTNLQYVDVDNPPRCVVITSSLPLEGKSTTASNLAIAMAQGGSRVLLVEADLRRPRVAEYLGVEGSIGMTDVLIGRALIDDAIIPWQRGLLDFLPSGAIPPNPSELLGSQQLADLLAELRARYGVVILDAPPLLPVTDAAILATAADGAILVARFGVTRHEQAERAADLLRQVNARLFGTILNCVPEKRSAGGYGYGYGYGYGNAQPTNGKSDNSRRVVTHDAGAAPEARMKSTGAPIRTPDFDPEGSFVPDANVAKSPQDSD